MSRLFLTTFVILCGVALFITGIPLAKYLSSQYLELRGELNSQDIILKHSSREVPGPTAEKLESTNENQNVLLPSKETEDFELHTFSPDTIAGSLQTPVKLKKRSKRRAPEHKENLLSWFFNLTVTEHSNETSKTALDASPLKRSETTIIAQATARKETALGELQNALKSVQIYLKSFFANTKENDKELEINNNLRAHFENGSLEIRTKDGENVDAVEFGTESNETSPSTQKGREGKSIFGLFGLWNRPGTTTEFPKQRPTQLPKQESTQSPEEEVSASAEPEKSNAFRKNEELTKTSSSINTDFVTQNSQESNFLTESLTSENISSMVIEGIGNMSQLNIQGVTKQTECLDCTTQKFELDDSTTEMKDTESAVSETVQATESFFTDEVLEKFCMSLVNKLEESQPEDDFDPELNPPDESNRLRSSQNPSILGLLTLFNSLKEKEAILDSAVIEDSFLVNDPSEFQTPLANRRQSRFLGFNVFGFGSGRSANLEDEPSDSISDGFNKNIDIENLPSILDCENYFRRKQTIKMFPKPNLMDMMSDPKIQLVDFANATISPKLKEQQLQFLTDLLKTSLNNSVDTFDNNMVDEFEKPASDKNSMSQEHFHSENKIMLNESKINDKLIDTSTNSNQELNRVTQTQRDARLFSVLGFGSGSDDSSRSSDSNPLLGFVGSGERFLETDTATEIDRNGELGSGEAFQGNIISVSEDLLELSTSVQERQFLGLMGFGGEGSGDGRELNESVEIVSTESYDCNDCEFENVHAENISKPCAAKHETECDDCNEISDDDKFAESVLNNQPTNFDRNITAESSRVDFEDCNCLENHSNRHASFLECDKCSSDDIEQPGDSPEIDESYIDEASEFANETKSGQGHGIDCDDCSYEDDVPSTNTTGSDQKQSFFECDDCNFGAIDASDEGYQLEVSGFINETSTQDHGNDCDDGSYEDELLSTNTTESDPKQYIFECEDCSFNTTDASNEGYQSEVSGFVSESSNQGHGIDCDDCVHETRESNTTDFDKETLFLECDDCRTNISIESKEANETFSYRETDLECDDCNSDIIGIQEESLSNIDANIASTEKDDHQTTEKIPRFMGSIFLTGSGDGNLFGDSGGSINLVEEESTIIAPAFPRRRARLDDIEEDTRGSHPKLLEAADWEKTSSSEMFPVSMQNFTDDPLTTASAIIVPIFPRRGARLDDTEEDLCDDCNIDFSEFGSNSKGFAKIHPIEEDESRPPKLSEKTDVGNGRIPASEVFPVSSQDSTDVSPTSKLQPRYCTSASQCNSVLNERCVTINSSSVCDCDRAYVRHKETRKCVVKRVVETSLKLPGEKFDEDLKNPLSPRYKQMEKNSLETMWLYLKSRPHLLSIIAEVELAGFGEGSLIVNWNLVFAVESDSETKLISDVEADLKEALKDEDLMQKAALNINNASVLAFTSEINPCSSSELNYCSENAYCVRVVNTAVPGRFVCYCKEHYRDVSTNPRYLGETCIAKCPPDYCGPNGHCEILANDERHCMCSGLYFGRRCEVPGIYVLVILAMVASISIAAVIVVAFRKRCRTVRYGGSQAFRRSEETGAHMYSNDRVSDAIALEENIGSKVTKYANISTPVPEVPVIRVTRPTICESSISFEGDSTFYATPSKTPSDVNKTEQDTSTI